MLRRGGAGGAAAAAPRCLFNPDVQHTALPYFIAIFSSEACVSHKPLSMTGVRALGAGQQHSAGSAAGTAVAVAVPEWCGGILLRLKLPAGGRGRTVAVLLIEHTFAACCGVGYGLYRPLRARSAAVCASGRHPVCPDPMAEEDATRSAHM